MNFENPNLNKKLENGPKEITIKKTWEDPELPEQVEADSWEATFKGFNKNGPKVPILEGVGFSVPIKKIPDVEKMQIGDKIQIAKIGGEIVSVTNIKTGKTYDMKTWQEEREKEMQKIREGAADYSQN